MIALYTEFLDSVCGCHNRFPYELVEISTGKVSISVWDLLCTSYCQQLWFGPAGESVRQGLLHFFVFQCKICNTYTKEGPSLTALTF